MMFRVCCTCVSAARRCLHKSHDRTLTEWHARYSIGGTLHTLLKRMSWSLQRPWVWKHDHTNAVLTLDKNHRSFEQYVPKKDDRTNHILREGFRAHAYNRWCSSARTDATLCHAMPYKSTRCGTAIKLASISRQNFATLSSAFVSEARFDTQKQTQVRKCSFCQQAVANTDHAFWRCHTDRPPDPMLARVGCPRNGHANDTIVLTWMNEVRVTSV